MNGCKCVAGYSAGSMVVLGGRALSCNVGPRGVGLPGELADDVVEEVHEL